MPMEGKSVLRRLNYYYYIFPLISVYTHFFLGPNKRPNLRNGFITFSTDHFCKNYNNNSKNKNKKKKENLDHTHFT